VSENTPPNKLQLAAHSLQSGDLSTAQTLLAQLLQSNPKNEAAWLLLAEILTDTAQRQYCLERVLAINPSNAQAHLALDKLLTPNSSSLNVSTTSAEPADGIVVSAAEAEQSSTESDPIRNNDPWSTVSSPPPGPLTMSEPSQTGPSFRVWLNAQSRLQSIACLYNDTLLVGRATNEQLAVLKSLNEELVISGFARLRDSHTIYLRELLRAHTVEGSAQLSLTSRSSAGSGFFRFADSKTSGEIFNAIQIWPEGDFAYREGRTNPLTTSFFPLLLIIALVALTYGLYQFNLIPLEELTGGEAIRGRLWMLVLLGVIRILGPGGVLCVGSAFTLGALVLLVRSFIPRSYKELIAKPSLLVSKPASTTATPAATKAKVKVELHPAPSATFDRTPLRKPSGRTAAFEIGIITGVIGVLCGLLLAFGIFVSGMGQGNVFWPFILLSLLLALSASTLAGFLASRRGKLVHEHLNQSGAIAGLLTGGATLFFLSAGLMRSTSTNDFGLDLFYYASSCLLSIPLMALGGIVGVIGAFVGDFIRAFLYVE
jgi:hypothetical protein